MSVVSPVAHYYDGSTCLASDFRMPEVVSSKDGIHYATSQRLACAELCTFAREARNSCESIRTRLSAPQPHSQRRVFALHRAERRRPCSLHHKSTTRRNDGYYPWGKPEQRDAAVTVPGYPPLPAPLAFSTAEHPEFVADAELDNATKADLLAATNAFIEAWEHAAAVSLHKHYRLIVEASQEQLDTLAELLVGAGVDVDRASWTAELSAPEISFAWGSAAQSCVLALLDWLVDWPDPSVDSQLVPKYAAGKLDPVRFTRATGLVEDHHQYALTVSWDTMRPSIDKCRVFYRARLVDFTFDGDHLLIHRSQFARS